jgi:hypothetical protein
LHWGCKKIKRKKQKTENRKLKTEIILFGRQNGRLFDEKVDDLFAELWVAGSD